MDLGTIPPLSIAMLKHNLPNFQDLKESEILEYFKCDFDINDIPSLTDEDKAVSLIKDVISRNGFILVCTDMDSDGLNSAAIAYKALKHKSNNFDVLVNKRVNGNGFNPVYVSKIKRIHDDKPIDLIITADHASSNRDELQELMDYGVKHVIITDHHEIPKDKYPDNVDVFINPQKADNDPKAMCGAFVLFKILSNLYLEDKDIFNKFYRECLPHAAIATITDVMDLRMMYNRKVVRAGLQMMNSGIPLWDSLAKRLNVASKYMYKDLGYVLGPFINTGNRTSKENLFYKILTTEDEEIREELIFRGVALNNRRKEVRKDMVAKLMWSIGDSVDTATLTFTVESPMAISGVLAGSVGEAYGVPTTCFAASKDEDILSGSARGVLDHVDIAQTFRAINDKDPDIFLKFGGHKGAGGCTIRKAKYEDFKRLFEEVVSSLPKPPKKETKLNYVDVNTSHLTPGMVEEIDYAGPYGHQWDKCLLRGLFKVRSVIAMSSMCIFTLVTTSGVNIKATYFYKENETKVSIEEYFGRDTVIKPVFDLQYYRRRNRISFTLMIEELTEA